MNFCTCYSWWCLFCFAVLKQPFSWIIFPETTYSWWFRISGHNVNIRITRRVIHYDILLSRWVLKQSSWGHFYGMTVSNLKVVWGWRYFWWVFYLLFSTFVLTSDIGGRLHTSNKNYNTIHILQIESTWLNL